MAARRLCSHDEAEAEVVSITTAGAGWGLATLWEPNADRIEFNVQTIAAWAVVRRDTSTCDCASTLVVPMTGLCGQLQFDLPDAHPADRFHSRIVEPGMRAVVNVCERTGRLLLRSAPGFWVPGPQAVNGGGR